MALSQLDPSMRLVAKARQGDALLIETRTKIRMARDWEAAQETSRSIQIPSEVAYYGASAMSIGRWSRGLHTEAYRRSQSLHRANSPIRKI